MQRGCAPEMEQDAGWCHRALADCSSDVVGVAGHDVAGGGAAA